MRTRNVIVMLAVAGALLALLLVTRQPESQREAKNAAIRETIFPEGLREKQIAQISIDTLGTTTVLHRVGERWYTGEAKKRRADADAVKGVFASLEKVSAGKLISRDPQKLLEFQVDKVTGRRVRMVDTNGKEILDVVIGKNPERDFTSTYVRPFKSDNTYLADAMLSYTFNRPGGWREKTMIKAEPDEFDRITIETTTGTIVLAKETSKTAEQASTAPVSGAEAARPVWRIEQPIQGEVKEGEMSSLTSRLRRFVANDVEDNEGELPLGKFGLDPAFATITFARGDREPIVLKIGSEKKPGPGAMRYAMVSGDDQIYLLSAPTCAMFFKQPSEFLK